MSAEYAEGGFTPDGPKKKVVGVVHAGEWIASQKLVKSPVARPLLEALEVAQRRNVIGVLPTVESQSVMRLEGYGVNKRDELRGTRDERALSEERLSFIEALEPLTQNL